MHLPQKGGQPISSLWVKLFRLVLFTFASQTKTTTMKLKTIVLIVFLSICHFTVFSQMMVSKSNVVFGPFFKMINTSQEVKVSPRITTQTTVKTRPATELHFFGLGQINVDGQNYSPFGKTTLSMVGNVTEMRIYSKKKGAFHGFYFGPYFSYTHFKLKSASIHQIFHDENGVEHAADVSQIIKLNMTGGGFQIGTQGMYFNNHFCIDWTIMGIGFGKLGFEGGIEADNTSDDFDLRNYPNDVANTQMGIEKYFTFKRTIDPKSITIHAGIPFPMFRMGVCIGFGYGGSWHFGKKKKDSTDETKPTVPTAPAGNWR
jgi:hypothetical protein